MSKYTAEFTGDLGTQWKVEIIDNQALIVAGNFTLGKDGFELNYQASNDNDPFAPLLPSEVTLFALSENSNFDLLVEEILESTSDRFFIKIYKNNSFYWTGLVVPEVSGLADESYPRSIKLKAVDGLSLLKNLNYRVGETTPHGGEETVLEHFHNCLEDLATFNGGMWAMLDNFVGVNCYWYANEHDAAAGHHPWGLTKINHKCFYNYDDDGEIVYRTVYDVLFEICQNWGGRLFLEDGIWKFRQPNTFKQSGIVFHTVYDTERSLVGNFIVNNEVTPVRLSTQSFDYIAALNPVTQGFRHGGSSNLLNGLAVNTDMNNTVLGNIDNDGGNATLLFSARLKIAYTGSNTPTNGVLVGIDLTIKLGSNYLTRSANSYSESLDYTGLSWQSASGSVEFVSQVMHTDNNEVYFEIPLKTPKIPASGILEINASVDFVRNRNGGNSSTNNADGIFEFAILEYNDTNEAEDYRLYGVGNTTTNSVQESLKLPDSNFGDSVVGFSERSLTVFDGDAFVPATGWRADTAFPYVPFTQLTIDEIISARAVNRLQRIGIFRGVFLVNDLVRVGNDLFVMIRGTLNASRSQWNGVWWKIKTQRGVIVHKSEVSQQLEPTLTSNSGFTPSDPENPEILNAETLMPELGT